MPLDSSWYPSAKLRLIIRFEEGSDKKVEKEARKAVVKAPIRASGVKDELAPLEVGTDPDAPPGTKRLFLGPKSGPKGGPQKQDASADEYTVPIGGIIPRRATLGLNGSREADSLSLEIRFLDCPIDPRTVRSCAVEFYLGTVSAEDYAKGVTGAQRDGSKEPLHVIPDTYTDSNKQPRTNLRFQGWVDDWEVEWPADERSTIRITCTDNTSILQRQDAPSKLVVDMKKPIDEAFAGYLANFPQFAGLAVEYRPADASPPVLAKALEKTAFRPNLGPPTAKGGGAPSKLSVLDYLTDLAGSVGHQVRVEGTAVVVELVRTFTAQSPGVRATDPYQGRDVGDGQRAETRWFVYGHNVQRMQVKRKYGRAAPANIEVRCFGQDTFVRAGDVVRVYRRPYSGAMVRIATADNRILTGTPNHPVLTLRGWLPLRELVEGDDLVDGSVGQRMKAFRDPHVDQIPTKIGELFDALSLMGATERRTGSAPNFHGDGSDGEIDVVTVDRELWNRFKTARAQHVGELGFVTPDVASRALNPDGSGNSTSGDEFFRDGLAAGGGVRLVQSGGSNGPLFGSAVAVSRCSAAIADGDATFDECLAQRPGISADALRNHVEAFPGEVPTSKIVEVTWINSTEGHVYNLETESNYYVAEGCVVHNCYNGKRKKTLVARFPQKDDRVSNPLPGEAKEQKWIVWRVSGIEDEAILRTVAQSVYESYGRNELNVQIDTRQLASFGGGNLDPDILDMKPGDPFEVLMAREESDDDGSVHALESRAKVEAKNQAWIEGLGFSTKFAKAYARAYTSSAFQSLFRLRTLTAQWDAKAGVSLSLQGGTYVEVRVDREGEADKVTQTTGTALAPTRGVSIGE